MRCALRILLIAFLVGGLALAQQSPPDQPPSNQPASNQSSSSQSSSSQSSNQPSAAQPSAQVPPNQAPPRSPDDEKAEREKSRDRSAEAGESSSRDTQIDTAPPKDDAKDHPNNSLGPATSAEDDSGDVQEVHPWNPYRAVKDDEVADYYYKQKAYKAALARYQDALMYKPNDAVANFHIAQCYEKLDQPDQAIEHYQEYLKILPEGPLSKQAKKALAKLGAAEKSKTAAK
jgi:tetratricopeptide (TPR) repeat protein